MAKVEVALSCRALLGESPVCLPSGDVHFADIMGHRIHTFHSPTGAQTSVDTNGSMVGCVVPCSAETLGMPRADLLAGLEDSIVAVDSNTGIIGSEAVLNFPTSHGGSKFRCNDGKCDPQGRLWIGTMNTEVHQDTGTPQKGRLYCVQKKKAGPLFSLDEDGKRIGEVEAVTKLEGVLCSNGLEWADQHMYYIDSHLQCVDVMNYSDASGDICNRRTVVNFPKEGGFPDGMTVDADGKLWVAIWKGGCVIQYDPHTGQEIQRVSIPAKFTTSVCFGGSDLSELYVTSSAEPDDGSGPDLVSEHPGALFRVHIPGVKGRSYSQSFTGGPL